MLCSKFSRSFCGNLLYQVWLSRFLLMQMLHVQIRKTAPHRHQCHDRLCTTCGGKIVLDLFFKSRDVGPVSLVRESRETVTDTSSANMQAQALFWAVCVTDGLWLINMTVWWTIVAAVRKPQMYRFFREYQDSVHVLFFYFWSGAHDDYLMGVALYWLNRGA